MSDPVMDLCAHNFERTAAEEWLLLTECCPISRKPLTSQDLVPNHTLAERIEQWQWRQDNDGLLVLPEQRGGKLSQSFSSDAEDDTDEYDNVGVIRKDGAVFSRLESDIEMAHPTGGSKKQHQVPVELTLLPQERRVLQIVRMRAREHREKKIRIAMCHAVSGFAVLFIVIFVSLAIARVLAG